MMTYVSPWMTSDLESFRRTVRQFLEREIVPRRETWEKQQHVDRALWLKAGELGMICASIPAEYGGMGGTYAHEAVIVEEQARVNDSAFGVVMASTLGMPLFMKAASEQQKHQWIPRIASGSAILAFALTEPGAGSDAKAIRTTARRKGDRYVINGQKTFISNGYNADLVMVVARTSPPEAGTGGISMFLVETRNQPGFRLGRILDKLGQKGQDTAELFFDDAEVPAVNLMGDEEGRGFAQIMSGFEIERTTIGLIGIANAERALELTVEYTKNRRAFGQALFDQPVIRQKLAECATEVRIGRIFIDDCIQRVIDGTLDNATASMAKWWCTELQGRVLDICVQLHGGYGYMSEYQVARMYADARVQRIYGGANEIQKEVVARAL
ncbi:acyl-CoA dehydrogenase [Bradyrhizobium diazoefficiens]